MVLIVRVELRLLPLFGRHETLSPVTSWLDVTRRSSPVGLGFPDSDLLFGHDIAFHRSWLPHTLHPTPIESRCFGFGTWDFPTHSAFLLSNYFSFGGPLVLTPALSGSTALLSSRILASARSSLNDLIRWIRAWIRNSTHINPITVFIATSLVRPRFNFRHTWYLCKINSLNVSV